MAVYFADTCALSKRYISEAGSAWLRSILDPGTGCETFIVRITAAELVAAITRRERGASLTPAEATTARTAFRADLLAEYQVVEVTEVLVMPEVWPITACCMREAGEPYPARQ